VHVSRIAGDREQRQDGITSDIEAIRMLYKQAVAVSEQSWDAAATEGMPDADAAKQVVEGLADAVTENRTALVALTAMRTYDNYTFTHMVNVSILTMGQARALGIEGRLLREFGLSALTPEMPILAPVVAFEHHLRRDGTGYPVGAVRTNLNLGTMLCSIADVFDAMRSQRAYQKAFPSDRVLAVLQRNDGTQFDQHLVRRFSQLMGIYPPGNLVRLGSGEVAVVVHVHAPDPYRPKVKVLYNRQGLAIEQPVERNLWEPREDGTLDQVVSPVDPADFGIDPLTYL
jgi:HD-GYP domain-containing protein (c-di-GMP phosphodiesterase class II)